MPNFESCSLSFPLSFAQVILRKPLKNEKPCVSWFIGDSLLFKSWDLQKNLSLVWDVQRTTIIGNGNTFISSPEHLSAALLLWHHLCIDIHVSEKTRELPLLDGSARDWLEHLRPRNPFSKELLFYEIEESFQIDFSNGFCIVEPSDTFEVEYSLEQEGFSDSAFVSIYAPEDLISVLNARTFIFENQFNKALAQGLLAGVSENSGLLLRPVKKSEVQVLRNKKLRFEQEILYHKVLDLVGDLSLFVQELPMAKIRIHNGGHIVHHQIFKRLVKYVHSRYPA